MKPNKEDFEKRKVVLAKSYELYDKLLNIYKIQDDKLTKAHM